MNRFWMLYVESSGGFNKKHETYEEAEVEAARLARKERKIVYILEAIKYGFVEEIPVTFHEMKEE